MLVFLYGSDTYRSREKLHELREAFQKKYDESGINSARFDGTVVSPETLGDALRNQPFFGVGKRMIVVERLLAKKGDADTWIPLLQNIPESTVCLLWDDLSSDAAAKHPINKAFPKKDGATHYAFDPLSGASLTTWVRDEAKRRETTIAPQAVERLVDVCGSDLWQLAGELDKLAAFRGHEEIRTEDVALLSTGTVEENIFAITDALAAQDITSASKHIREQISGGLEEMYLLTMLLRQIRLLTQVRSYLSQNPNAKREEIAKILGIHPFVAQKTAAVAQKFSARVLLALLDQLFDTDRAIKTGKLTPQLAIERILATVALSTETTK
jgi:DNA polymerase-3 subunit delta